MSNVSTVRTALESLSLKLELTYQKDETEMFRAFSDPHKNPDGWKYHSEVYQRILNDEHDFRYHPWIDEDEDYFYLKNEDGRNCGQNQILCRVEKVTGDVFSPVEEAPVANLLDYESKRALLSRTHYNKVIR